MLSNIKLVLILLTMVSTIELESCTHKEEINSSAIVLMNEGLQSSNKIISNNIRSSLNSLDENAKNFRAREKAMIWQPKALTVKKECDAFLLFLDSIRAIPDDQHWSQLISRLNDFNISLMAIDSNTEPFVKNEMEEFRNAFDSLKKSSIRSSKYFNTAPVLTKRAFLTKIQNDILIQENNLLTFCYYQTLVIFCGFDQLSVLIGQNTNHLRNGEEIEITAGMGSFSRASNPKFTIQGKSFSLGNDNVVVYKTKVSGLKGQHFTPVEVDYVDQRGERQKLTYKIKYFIDD